MPVPSLLFHSVRRGLGAVPALTAMGLLLQPVLVSAQSSAPDFHADVAPILRDYCLGCHTGKDAEGGLRMETFAQLKKGGESGSVLLDRDGKKPLLAAVLRGEKPAMPPRKEPQPSEADIQTLEAWIASGASGPKKGDIPLQNLLNIPALPLTVRESKTVTALAFSRDGTRMARARYRDIEVFEAKSRMLLHRFEGLEGKVSALHFSPDGTALVAATGVPGVRGTLVHWNLEGEPKRVDFPVQHRDLIQSVQWSSDGKYLATGGYDSKVVIWDAGTRRHLRSLSGHNGAIFSVAFHPSNTLLASASADQTVKIWRLRDGARLDTLKDPQGEQYCVTFNPEGTRIFAAGADNRLRMWEMLSLEKETINPLLETRYAHEGAITGLVMHADGSRLLTVSRDKTPKVWTIPELEVVRVLPTQPDTPSAAAYDPAEQEALVAHSDGSLERYAFRAEDLASAAAGGAATGVSVKEGAPGSGATDPLFGLRSALVPPAPVHKLAETEPNDQTAHATALALPAEVEGAIAKPGDQDVYAFDARKGDHWIFEVFAARNGSPLDSKLEVLAGDGRPIERVALQAIRSSWLAFRGRDFSTTDDFRIQHGREAELDEYLYGDGEVTRLWGYPNGPDSGFTLYPGFGKRHTYFGTSACSHPLGTPLYVVRPLPAGSQPAPNGLPVFRLHYENDDDPARTHGKDSVVDFAVPQDGRYFVRVSDARGFGDAGASYRLVVRSPKPDFSLSAPTIKTLAVSPGSGKELEIGIERLDGFEGEITAEITGLPAGFHAIESVRLEPAHKRAFAAIWAESDARVPEKMPASAAKIVARARIGGREVSHEVPLPELCLGPAPKIKVRMVADKGAPGGMQPPLELTIRPGQTISARAVADRIDFAGRIEFARDSFKNLPHGVFMANVGLNGLLIVEGETERNFSITAAKWVQPTTRWVFLRSTSDGGHVTQPVLLHVRP